MQIVIEIPDDFYKKVQDNYRLGNGDADAVQIPIGCIANGTPLPKGHGALKDANSLEDYIKEDADEWDKYALAYVENAPTIIEADKVKSEE